MLWGTIVELPNELAESRLGCPSLNTEEQRAQPDLADLDFKARLALLVERQWLWRENRAVAARLQQAQLKLGFR